jgi:Uma2 family endonuclease
MAVEPAQQLQHSAVERWRFTVDDFYRMGEVGIFPPDARVELIDGDVIKMAPIGSHHNGSVAGLDEILRELLGRRVTIVAQGPLRLSAPGRAQANPQPDILVLKRRDDFYRHANPTAADVLLVIEVSDSTLAYDRDTKAPMYARAGIPEYWIVDLTGSRLLVYREPRDGVYRSVEALTGEHSVSPIAFPEIAIAVADILG